MAKWLIDLDDELLDAAQREIHTSSASETVNAALKNVAATAARARQIDWLSQGGLAEYAAPQ